MTAATAPPRRSAAEQRRLEAALTELFERLVTFNQVLGLKVM
jgi:phage gp29-like protein